MGITSNDLDQMWEEEKRFRARTALEKIALLLEHQARLLRAMETTCRQIENTLKGGINEENHSKE